MGTRDVQAVAGNMLSESKMLHRKDQQDILAGLPELLPVIVPLIRAGLCEYAKRNVLNVHFVTQHCCSPQNTVVRCVIPLSLAVISYL